MRSESNHANKASRSFSSITLRKTLSLPQYFCLGFGSIIGVGWVVFMDQWLVAGGPLGTILGFVIGGLLLIPVGKAYAELTSAMPVSGGELAFTYKAFGSFKCFISIWLLVLAYMVVCPFETVAMGAIVEDILPTFNSATLYKINGQPICLVSIIPGLCIGALIWILNHVGVGGTARFQVVSTATMLLLILAMVLVAILRGNLGHVQPLFSGESSGWISSTKSVFSVVIFVPFFLAGFDSISQAAEESCSRTEPRKLGLVIISSIVAAAVCYATVSLAAAVCMPWQKATGQELLTAAVFRTASGEWAARLVLIAAFLGLVTSLNGFFFASTRLLFSAARAGLLPEWFARLHPKNRTPTNSVALVGVVSLIGPFLGKPLLLPIVHVGSLCFVLVWFFSCVSAIELRRSAPTLNRPYRVKHKATLHLGAVVSLILALLCLVPGTGSALVWPSEFIIVCLWLFLGLLLFLLGTRFNPMSKRERDLRILGVHPQAEGGRPQPTPSSNPTPEPHALLLEHLAGKQGHVAQVDAEPA